MKKVLGVGIFGLVLVSAGLAVEVYIEAKDLLTKEAEFNLKRAQWEFRVLQEQLDRANLTERQLAALAALESELFPEREAAKYQAAPYIPNAEQRNISLRDLPGYDEEEALNIEDIDLIEYCELHEEYVDLQRQNASVGVWWNKIVPSFKGTPDTKDLLVAAYLEVPYTHLELTDEENAENDPCRYPLAGAVYLYAEDTGEILDEELGNLDQRQEVFKTIKF